MTARSEKVQVELVFVLALIFVIRYKVTRTIRDGISVESSKGKRWAGMDNTRKCMKREDKMLQHARKNEKDPLGWSYIKENFSRHYCPRRS